MPTSRILSGTVYQNILPVLLFIGAIMLIALRDDLPLLAEVTGWGALLLGLTLYLRRFWFDLFGPVFFYDFVRTARRGHQIGHRFLYAFALLLVIFGVYWSWFPGGGLDSRLFTNQIRISISERARFAESFFQSFMVVQFLVVLIVTPAYTSGAIAEEKERRSLEFLLATDLTDREIVLGMMAARLSNIVLLVLTGLPVLSAFEFLGGVDPNLVLAGFMATALSVLSLGAVSILMSVLCRTPLAALVQTYLWVFLYLFLSFACCVPFLNPFTSGSSSATASSGYAIGLLLFSGIHALIAVFCCRQAIAQLRVKVLGTTGGPRFHPSLVKVARKPKATPAGHDVDESIDVGEIRLMVQGWGPEPEPAASSNPRSDSKRAPAAAATLSHWVEEVPECEVTVQRRKLPPIKGDALLWKELYTEHAFALPQRESMGAILMALVLVILTIAFTGYLGTNDAPYGIARYCNGIVRGIGTPLYGFLGLIVALNAARRVSHERQRRTLDGLLMLPVQRETILFAKWLGSLLCVRGLWWTVAGIWALGLVTGGLSLFAFPLVVAGVTVFLVFMASLGLWLSTVYNTTLRSTLFTLLLTLCILIGPSYVASVAITSFKGSAQEPLDISALLAEYGLNPMGALWKVAYRGAEMAETVTTTPLAEFGMSILCFYFYMLAAVLLYLLSSYNLRSRQGPRPDRKPPFPVSPRPIPRSNR